MLKRRKKFLFLVREPQNFGFLCIDVLLAGQGEEQVGEAVDVGGDTAVDGAFGCDAQDAALGTAADGAADVGLACGLGSAGKDKGAKRWQLAVDEVDGVFQLLDHLVGHDAATAQFGRCGVGGEVGAYDEEHVLDVGEECAVGVAVHHAGEQADVAVQFVDGAVGFEAVAAFADALSAHERGLAGIAGAGVEGRFLHGYMR